MQATLIYNARAGHTSNLTPEALMDALSGIGYRPVYRATEHQDSLQDVLQDAEGTVFVAGGDGSVRAVTPHLIGRPLRLGILPMGTANNIGRTLGIEGDTLDLIERYREAVPAPFDVGRVTAPWGEDLFLEGFGCGLFADLLAEYDPEDGKSPWRAAQAVLNTVPGYAPAPTRVRLDGVDHSGMYALLEVLNTCAVGPRLTFAPTADPGDGRFDVVRVDGQDRDSAAQYLNSLVQGTFPELNSVRHTDAGVIEFDWEGQRFHVDGEVRPGPDVTERTGTVRVEVLPAALHVLKPSPLPRGDA